MIKSDRTNHCDAPVCPVDFYGNETIADPVPGYHDMLSRGPVVWLEANQILAICGFSELTRSLRNHNVLESGKGVSINDELFVRQDPARSKRKGCTVLC